MTLKELKGKYARLSNEIDELAAAGGHNQARLVRLMNDLDQVHRDLTELRHRTFAAPTLRDAVPTPMAVPAAAPRVLPMQPVAQSASVAPMPIAAALSMAG
jgi:hypothetical protein